MYYIGDGMMRLNNRRGGVDPVVVFAVAVVVSIAAVVGYYWWRSRIELEKMTLYPQGDGGKCVVIDTRKPREQRIWREGDTTVTETVWYADMYYAVLWFSLEPPIEEKIVLQIKVEGEASTGYVTIHPSRFSDGSPVQWYWFCTALEYMKKDIWYTVELREDGGSVEPEIKSALWVPESHWLNTKPDAIVVGADHTDKPVRVYVRILYRD